MQDDKPKNDDNFDDDLEFDDLDEDDVLDESWEDLEELDEDSKPAPVRATSVKSKSFLQKNFNAIVIGVVVVGGGLFLIPNLLGTKPTGPEVTAQTTEQLPQAVSEGELQQGELPPMPTPINSQPEELAQVPQEDPVLTPLPDETSAPPLPDLAAEPALDLQPSATTPPPEMAEPVPAPEEPELYLSATTPPSETAEPVPTPEAPAPTAQADIGAPEAPDVTPPDIAPIPIDNTAETQAMEAELNTANAKIEALNTTLSDLQKQIEDLEKAKAKNEEAAQKIEDMGELNSQATAPAPKPAKAPKKKKAPSPPKSENKQTADSSSSAAKWVLRSAQTGSAVIAPQGGNDFVKVTVGDTFPGLGTITSIGQENGRWVVKGSQGEVRQ